MKDSVVVLCGHTPDGRKVIGGAFQMADTHGYPLWASLDWAEERGYVISFPHYFASAIEHGWDDRQTFSKIREALADRGDISNYEHIRDGCVMMFMLFANQMPGKSAMEIATAMRESMEQIELAKEPVEA